VYVKVETKKDIVGKTLRKYPYRGRWAKEKMQRSLEHYVEQYHNLQAMKRPSPSCIRIHMCYFLALQEVNESCLLYRIPILTHNAVLPQDVYAFESLNGYARTFENFACGLCGSMRINQ
jgi:hypothetical protein